MSHRIARLAWLLLLAPGFLLFMGMAAAQERPMFPTLITVLRDHDVPTPPTGLVDAGMTITSFSFVDNPAQFAIAYYRDTGTDALKPPLYLLRYDKHLDRWYATQHSEDNPIKAAHTAAVQGSGAASMEVECFGSVGLRAIPGYLLLSTHLSPSAECTAVLTPDLQVAAAVSGWPVATLPSTVIFERSEMHFAPTHPLRIAALGLATGRETEIYPPADDPLREDFQKRLGAVADLDWCREHDSHCDPKRMTTELGDVAVNEKQAAIAFDVMFDSEGFGPRADAEIGGEKYFYVFKLAPKLQYREFDEFDMKPMFGEVSAKVLVRPDVLRRVFSSK